VPSGISAWIIHQRFGIPYVIYTHGAELLTWERSIRTRHLLRKVLQDASWVGAVSRFTAGLLKDLGVSENAIRMLPPAIDPEPFGELREANDIRQRYGLFSKRILLTHGRLIPRKGHDTVIRSLPSVISAYPDVVYLITGVGPNEEHLKALVAELKLGSHVIFGGSIMPQELPALYQACDVFVMASRTIKESVEGFGIVCLEAAAAGKPVVAARSGGVVDSVLDGVTGYHIDPDSTEELASRLCQLLGNKTLRDQLGAAGRRRVCLDFDSNAFTRRMRRYIDETMLTSKRKDDAFEAISAT
jgi:phosphatidylinositol alpha-1,6-mannosyltransferase